MISYHLSLHSFIQSIDIFNQFINSIELFNQSNKFIKNKIFDRTIKNYSINPELFGLVCLISDQQQKVLIW